MNRSLTEALAHDLDGAFPRLIDATQDRVYSTALALTGSRHAAEDVAQDAYVRAYRALRDYPPARIRSLQPRPWLAKIALNVWRNSVRGPRRDAVSLDDDKAKAAATALTADPADRPDHRAMRSETHAELRGLLSALPARYRAAVVLRHVEGLHYREAAKILDAPVGTVKANVHRGLRMLRDALERRAKEVLS